MNIKYDTPIIFTIIIIDKDAGRTKTEIHELIQNRKLASLGKTGVNTKLLLKAKVSFSFHRASKSQIQRQQ